MDLQSLVAELQKRNALLESRLANLEKKSGASGLQETIPTPAHTPIVTPRRSPRRSPRRRSPQKRKTSDSSNESSASEQSPVVKRRLSQEMGTQRTPKTNQQQTLRKTMGTVIKMNMDARLLRGEFRDKRRRFDTNKFEDEVRPILDYIIKTDEVDTEGISRLEIFKIAVSIAKKRQDYTPRKKKGKKKTSPAGIHSSVKRERYVKTKAAARSIYTAIVASVNAERSPNSPLSVASAKVANTASAAEAVVNADPKSVTDLTDPKSDSDEFGVDELFDDDSTDADEGENNALIEYNKKCQNKRALDRRNLQEKKVQATKDKIAKKQQAEKVKLAKLAKKQQAAKAKLAKKQQAEKGQNQLISANLKSYIASMASEAVAASKAVPVWKRNKADCLFEVGMNVCGYWPEDQTTGEGGEWYEGVVISLDYVHRTVHIQYNDGDMDDAVPWHKARILDELKDG